MYTLNSPCSELLYRMTRGARVKTPGKLSINDNIELFIGRRVVDFCVSQRRNAAARDDITQQILSNVGQCWDSVADAGPALIQHWIQILFLFKQTTLVKQEMATVRNVGPIPCQRDADL